MPTINTPVTPASPIAAPWRTTTPNGAKVAPTPAPWVVRAGGAAPAANIVTPWPT